MPHWIIAEDDKHKEVWYKEVRETYRPEGTRNPVAEKEAYFASLPEFLREEARANWRHQQQLIMIKPFPKVEEKIQLHNFVFLEFKFRPWGPPLLGELALAWGVSGLGSVLGLVC